jgi:hypothetical protein
MVIAVSYDSNAIFVYSLQYKLSSNEHPLKSCEHTPSYYDNVYKKYS